MGEIMDKRFLLTYTCIGTDGFRHSYNAWFETEQDMQSFVEQEREKGKGFEEDISIEILNYRDVKIN